MGWIIQKGKTFQIKSYRTLCSRTGSVGLWTNIEADSLTSIKNFKGFIVACAESSHLRSQYRRMKGQARIYDHRERKADKLRWFDREDNFFFNIFKKTDNRLCGRVFNGTIKGLTGISTRTVSRWRKYSPNDYLLDKYLSDYHYIHGREDNQISREYRGYMTTDLLITSNIEVFSIKSYMNNSFGTYHKYNISNKTLNNKYNTKNISNNYSNNIDNISIYKISGENL